MSDSRLLIHLVYSPMKLLTPHSQMSGCSSAWKSQAQLCAQKRGVKVAPVAAWQVSAKSLWVHSGSSGECVFLHAAAATLLDKLWTMQPLIAARCSSRLLFAEFIDSSGLHNTASV